MARRKGQPTRESSGARGGFVASITCPCGKRAYRNRREARQVAKIMRRDGITDPDRGTLGTYECLTLPGSWHVGHSTRNGANLNDGRVRVVPS